MTRRAAAAILALLVAAGMLLLPALAAADGDPASDVLLGQNVFYPYSPAVPPTVRAKLDAQAAAAKAAGFPIKVALIAAPTDLGVIPSLFGKPQSYAKFLDSEISFRAPQPLLVVMRAGYGVAGVSAKARSALSLASKPAGGTSTDLARSATSALGTLAAASGHPLQAATHGSSAPAKGSDRTLLLIVLIAAAILVATGLVVLRARQSASS